MLVLLLVVLLYYTLLSLALGEGFNTIVESAESALGAMSPEELAAQQQQEANERGMQPFSQVFPSESASCPIGLPLDETKNLLTTWAIKQNCENEHYGRDTGAIEGHQFITFYMHSVLFALLEDLLMKSIKEILRLPAEYICLLLSTAMQNLKNATKALSCSV